MNKILEFFSIPDFRRDMTASEITHRSNKIAVILLTGVTLAALGTIPLYGSMYDRSHIHRSEWKCPKASCGYDNYDGIDYCGLCGTAKPKRKNPSGY